MGNFELCSAAGLNAVEAAVWIVIGLYLFFLSRKGAAGGSQRDVFVLGALFVAFGLSDVAEVYSGAWWRPRWLLVWKILNAVGLLYFAGRRYLAERARCRRSSVSAPREK